MNEKIHYGIEAVLVVAVVVLFVFQFSGSKKSPNAGTGTTGTEVASGSAMPVAYIDVDSLMLNYKYSIDMNEQLIRKYEDSQVNLNEKVNKWQADAQSFQRKAETGSFISQERMDSERDRIIKSQEDLEAYRAKLSQDFSDEQLRMNENLRKSILTHLEEYNKDKSFHLIYGRMNDNILYADRSYNITAEIIDFLNKKYAASPALAPK